jgi:hypothetical protein
MKKLVIIITLCLFTGIVVTATLAIPAPAKKEFKVPGILAWNVAHKHGFNFYPNNSIGSKNGSDTPGRVIHTIFNNALSYAKGTRESRIIGGTMMRIIGKRHPYKNYQLLAYFHYFQGKKLGIVNLIYISVHHSA